ncbi:hypothetical protein JXA88_04895 [Candidatus Fermentibacteria bacterium]|nr:hypothetical protein [Candidatus Fermentibacteria bacterium]
MDTTPVIFSGTHACLVDDKGRLTVPKSMREQVPSSQEKYWVTLMFPERCVAVYPEAQWHPIYAKRVDELAQSDTPENRERYRAVLEKTYTVRPDTQGRFKVHPALARAAGLEGQILAIGFGDHVEYWSLSRREQYVRSMGASDDDSCFHYADTIREDGGGDGVDR